MVGLVCQIHLVRVSLFCLLICSSSPFSPSSLSSPVILYYLVLSFFCVLTILTCIFSIRVKRERKAPPPSSPATLEDLDCIAQEIRASMATTDERALF